MKVDMDKLIQRPIYLAHALAFKDTDLVKVVTGVRRCGKSSLLELVKEHLIGAGVPESSVVFANLEDIGLGIRYSDDLYSYFKARLATSGKAYIFIDEVQRVEGWHDAVNAMRVAFDCDIYVTGSNAFLLSGELATYLSGRYVEIKMLPLAFSEYVGFCGVELNDARTAGFDASGEIVLTQDLLARFMTYGGMPAIANLGTTQGEHESYMESLYESVVVRDIMNRERRASERRISDPALLRKLVEFLADNTGNATSLNKVADTLSAAGSSTTRFTVAAYAKALTDAYLFYPCMRYDIHGRDILKTAPKYYLVDTGLRSYLGGYRGGDLGRTFENVVFLQLAYEGWKVHVGKLYGKEVDFVATKDGRIVYIQVADEMFEEKTRERELLPLRSIRDNHEKWIVVRQGSYPADIDGIRIIGPEQFFFSRH